VFLVLAGLLLAGACGLSALPAARRLRGHRGGRKRGLGALRSRPLRVMVGVVALTDAAIGCIQVGIAGTAAATGHPEAAGAILAGVLLGAMCTSLLVATRTFRLPPVDRYERVLWLFSLGLVPLCLASSLPALALVAAIAGLALGPKLSTSIAVVNRVAPAEHLAEAYSWMVTASGLGVAAGAALAGVAADELGARTAFVAAIAAALLAAAATSAQRDRLRATAAPAPSAA